MPPSPSRVADAAEKQRGADLVGGEETGGASGIGSSWAPPRSANNRSHHHEARPAILMRDKSSSAKTAALPVGPTDRATTSQPMASGGRLPSCDDVEPPSPQPLPTALKSAVAAASAVPPGRKHSALVAVTVLMRSGLRLQHHFNVSETLQTVQNWGRSSRAIAADDSEEFVILQPATRFTAANLRKSLEELKLPTEVHLSVVRRLSRPAVASDAVDTSQQAFPSHPFL